MLKFPSQYQEIHQTPAMAPATPKPGKGTGNIQFVQFYLPLVAN